MKTLYSSLFALALCAMSQTSVQAQSEYPMVLGTTEIGSALAFSTQTTVELYLFLDPTYALNQVQMELVNAPGQFPLGFSGAPNTGSFRFSLANFTQINLAGFSFYYASIPTSSLPNPTAPLICIAMRAGVLPVDPLTGQVVGGSTGSGTGCKASCTCSCHRSGADREDDDEFEGGKDCNHDSHTCENRDGSRSSGDCKEKESEHSDSSKSSNCSKPGSTGTSSHSFYGHYGKDGKDEVKTFVSDCKDTFSRGTKTGSYSHGKESDRKDCDKSKSSKSKKSSGRDWRSDDQDHKSGDRECNRGEKNDSDHDGEHEDRDGEDGAGHGTCSCSCHVSIQQVWIGDLQFGTSGAYYFCIPAVPVQDQ